MRFQRTVEIGGGGSPVNQEVRAGDESTLAAHQQFRYMGYFIAVPGLLAGHFANMFL